MKNKATAQVNGIQPEDGHIRVRVKMDEFTAMTARSLKTEMSKAIKNNSRILKRFSVLKAS